MDKIEDKNSQLERRVEQLEKSLAALQKQKTTIPQESNSLQSVAPESYDYSGPPPLAIVGLIIGGLISLFAIPNIFSSIFNPYGSSSGFEFLIWPIIGVGILGFSIKSIAEHHDKGKKDSNVSNLKTTVSAPTIADLNIKEVKENSGGTQTTEFKIASSWFAIVGMAAIILGAVFFLKYAFDNGLIGPVGQVCIGILFGLSLLGAGEFLRTKYPKYSFVISGGGVVVLYLSMWASYGIFHLTDQVVTLGAMSVVTILSSLLAIRYQALPIAILGLLGGFVTPLLLAKGFDNQILLMSYIVILDLGVLGIAIFKNWLQLNVLGLAGTYIVFLSWYGTYYTKEQFLQTMIFLTIIFFIFALVMFIYNVINNKKTIESDVLMMASNALVYFGLSYVIVKPLYPEFLGFFAFFMALFYFVLGYLAFIKFQKDDLLTLSFLGISILFLTIAVPLQVTKNLITIIWSLEAAILLGAGFWLSSYKLRVAALAVYILVAIRLLAFDANLPLTEFVLFLNKRFATFVIAVISLGIASYLYSKFKKLLSGDETNILAILAISMNVVLVSALSLESLSYFNSKIQQASGVSAIETAVLAEKVVKSSIIIPSGILENVSCNDEIYNQLVVGNDTRCQPSVKTKQTLIFKNLHIPSGSTITGATLSLHPKNPTGKVFFIKISDYILEKNNDSANPFIVIKSDIGEYESINAINLIKASALRGTLTEDELWLNIEDSGSDGYFVISTTDLSKLPTITVSYEENLAPLVATGAALPNNSTKSNLNNNRNYNQAPTDYPKTPVVDSVEITNLKSMRDVSLSLIWGIYSIVLIIVGIVAKYKPIRLAALGFFAITIFKVFLFDSRYLEQGYRIIAFMVLGGILLMVSLLYQKYKDKISELLTE